MTSIEAYASSTAGRGGLVTAGDVNIWHARLLADQQITYVMEFDGQIDAGRLRHALALLNTALPLLSCVVQVRGPQFAWVPLAGGRPSLSLARDEEEGPGAVARFTGLPCDPERDTPLKLFLLQRPGRDTLAVKVDHMLTDAAGLKYLLGLLGEAYSIGSIRQTGNPDRGFGQVLRRFSVPALVRAARQASVPRPGPGLFVGPFQAGDPFVEQACMEPDEFGRLRRAVKTHGATVNDAVLAAVYHAAFQRLGPGAPAYPVMVPVDMRHYLPEAERGVIGNLSSAIYPMLAPCPRETMGALLARVQAAMEPMKQANPGLGAMLLMAVGAAWGGAFIHRRYARAVSSDRRFINVTNFGIIEREHVTFEGARVAEAYGVGPVQSAPGIVLALSTYADRLHLVVQSDDAGRFQPFIRGFLGDVLDGLHCLAA